MIRVNFYFEDVFLCSSKAEFKKLSVEFIRNEIVPDYDSIDGYVIICRTPRALLTDAFLDEFKETFDGSNRITARDVLIDSLDLEFVPVDIVQVCYMLRNHLVSRKRKRGKQAGEEEEVFSMFKRRKTCVENKMVK